MVERKRAAGILVLTVLLCLLLLAFTGAGAAEKPTITEDYRITINDVGDGHVVDTIKYSKEDYGVVKKVEKKNRGFLTRRYEGEDLTGEVLDFNADLDDATHSVIITYDKPGLAYNTEGEYVLYGYSDKPGKSSGNEFVFEEQSTVNSEFTLFTDQVIKTTTTIELPGSASNARYDADDSAIKYDMPPATAAYGFFGKNKVTLSVVFGVCTLVLAGLLVLVLTRKPREAAAAPAAAASAPPSIPAPATAPADSAAGKDEPSVTPGTCPVCGGGLKPGKRFCTHCGARV